MRAYTWYNIGQLWSATVIGQAIYMLQENELSRSGPNYLSGAGSLNGQFAFIWDLIEMTLAVPVWPNKEILVFVKWPESEGRVLA